MAPNTEALNTEAPNTEAPNTEAPNIEAPNTAAPATKAPADFLAAAEELYAWNCAVCHGATGGGLEEAKLAFPEDHRDCTRCHRPSNRVVQPLDQPFNDHDMFSIGVPPALHADDSADESPAADRPLLAAVAPPSALHAYIAATMPRYDPGRLSDEDYWALTAFLLELNGRHAKAAEIALRK